MNTDEQVKEILRKAEHTKDPLQLWAFWKALDDMSAFQAAKRVEGWMIKAQSSAHIDREVE